MKINSLVFFTLIFFSMTTPSFAETWLHITDHPWAGFNGQLTYAVTSQRAHPAAGDIDHDGDLDVAVGAYDGTIIIYWNDGDNTFTEDLQTLSEFDVGYYAVPTFADVNNDSLEDLLVGASDGTLTLLIAQADKTFIESSSLNAVNVDAYSVPFASDLNDDGVLDVLVGGIDGTVDLFINNGSGTSFTQDAVLLAGLDVDSDSVPVVADITCDGLNDVLLGSADGNLALYAQTVAGEFVSQGTLETESGTIDVGDYSIPAVLDANADDCTDLLVGSSEGLVSLFINNGDGSFTENTVRLDTPDVGAYAVPRVVDLDGADGEDIVIGASDGILSVYWNDGTGYFDDTETLYAGIDVGDFSIPTAHDLDGNGYNDILMGNTEGTLSLYLNMGNGTYLQDAIRFSSVDAGDTSIPASADLNGDDLSDVVVGAADGTLTYLTQNTDNTFTDEGLLEADSTSIDVGSNAFPVASDIDDDDDVDLVVGAYGSRLTLYTNNGAGIFTNSHAFDSLSFETDLVPEVNDLDGDGRKDVIVGDGLGQVIFLKQNADGSFSDQGALQASGETIDVGEEAIPKLVDMNEDDVNDLLVSNADGRLLLFINSGSSTFTQDTTTFANFDVGDNATLFVSDINADDKNDILLGSLSGRLFLITTDYDDDTYVGLLDCDNNDYHVYTGAPEICDFKDNDCDDEIDEEDTTGTHRWYADTDGDHYGDPLLYEVSCTSLESTVSNGDDCNDTDPLINPGVAEVCADATDNDCDGLNNEGCAGSPDFDDDGDGYAEEGGDCDDTDSSIAPNADETCNEIDDDCDLSVDEDATDAITLYHDADDDGFGDPTDSVLSCSSYPSYTSDQSDCNDSNAVINPSATESCDDAVDNNCNGTVNEDCATDSGASDPSDTSDSTDPSDPTDQSDSSDSSDSSDDGVDPGESEPDDPVDTPDGDPVPIPKPSKIDGYGMPSACSLNSAQTSPKNYPMGILLIGLLGMLILKSRNPDSRLLDHTCTHHR